MTLRALDLFCCAGGASEGLTLAGFEVTGVDLDEQPHYPYPSRFIRADALSLSLSWLRSFDLIWASPPCQQFTAYRRKNPAKIGASALNLIPQTRSLLREVGRPYIIENVESAPLENPITLCGSMFGLDVRRHRLFETSFPVVQPRCDHTRWKPRFPPASNRKNLRRTVEVGVYRIPLATQKIAMGIAREISLDRLSQAIPPAYARFLAESARQFMK